MMQNLLKQRLPSRTSVELMVLRKLFSSAPASIPINGTARLVRLKVSGEQNAIKAQDLLLKAHQVLKKDAKGYVGSTRYVCKAEWDIYCWYRFANLDSLKAYLGSETHTKKIEPILGELKALANDGKVHGQNFVADDW
jgi:hypothetical protein